MILCEIPRGAVKQYPFRSLHMLPLICGSPHWFPQQVPFIAGLAFPELSIVRAIAGADLRHSKLPPLHLSLTTK